MPVGNLAKELGVPATRWSVVVGNARNEIVRVAIDRAVDLIVVGTRFRLRVGGRYRGQAC
jgi:nucleotide-binding universal stress UspA family protein